MKVDRGVYSRCRFSKATKSMINTGLIRTAVIFYVIVYFSSNKFLFLVFFFNVSDISYPKAFKQVSDKCLKKFETVLVILSIGHGHPNDLAEILTYFYYHMNDFQLV